MLASDCAKHFLCQTQHKSMSDIIIALLLIELVLRKSILVYEVNTHAS